MRNKSFMRHLDDLLSRLEAGPGPVAQEGKDGAAKQSGQSAREWAANAHVVGESSPTLTAQAEA